MNTRIKFLRKTLELSQKEFADRIGLKQNAISYLEKENATITEQNIKSICSQFNVNENWLRFGKGNMFLEDKKYKEFLDIYNGLSSELQDYLFTSAKELLNTQQKLNQSNEELSTTELPSINLIPRIGCKEPVYNEPTAIDYDDPDIKEKMEAYRRELTEKKKVKRLLESKPTKETGFGNLLA